MSLYDDIIAGGFDLQNRDDGAIAAALSVGRTEIVSTEIGVGLVLETLGIADGNALLDYIKSDANFRYVWPLIEQGRLNVGSTLVRGTLDALAAGGVISPANADALKNLAVRPAPITSQDVAKALEGK